MNEHLDLMRIKSIGSGLISHASPENSRLARLGADYLWACIHGAKRLVFFHPHTQTILSSLGEPLTTVVQDLAVAVVRNNEILRFGLKKGESVEKNGVKTVMVI